MGKFKRFILNLQFIFRPRYWIMNYEYSPKWDKELNVLLDKYTFDKSTRDEWSVSINNTKVWISLDTYPYASFLPFFGIVRGEFRPSRLTIKKAYKKFIEEINPSKDPYDYYN